MSQDKTRSHETVIEIAAPIDAVWRAITEAEEIVRWFSPEVKVTPGVGGSIWVSWGQGLEGTARIEIWEPGRHLRTVEDTAARRPGAAPQVVDWHLQAKEGGTTVLRLVHSGFGLTADWDEEYDSTRKGWATFFGIMKHGLERHAGVPARNVTVYRPVNVAWEEAWARLMSPRGLVAGGTLDGAAPGSRYRIRTAMGEMLEGVVRRFDVEGYVGLTVEPLNDALLTIFCERSKYTLITITWVLYGLPPEVVEDVRARWTAMVDQLFPQAGQASA